MRRLSTLLLALLLFAALSVAGMGPSAMLPGSAMAATMATTMSADGTMADCPHGLTGAEAGSAHHSGPLAGPHGGAAKPLALMACCVVLPGIAAATPVLAGPSAIAMRLAPALQRIPKAAMPDPVRPPPRA